MDFSVFSLTASQTSSLLMPKDIMCVSVAVNVFFVNKKNTEYLQNFSYVSMQHINRKIFTYLLFENAF